MFYFGVHKNAFRIQESSDLCDSMQYNHLESHSYLNLKNYFYESFNTLILTLSI